MDNNITTAPPAPQVDEFAGSLCNLADARLGAEIVMVSDQFFAAAEGMLKPSPPVFIDGKFDHHGKWMDGWETRRKRGPGHDWAIVRLARPGVPSKVDLDTTFFTGNFAPAASLDGCVSESEEPAADVAWQSLLAETVLHGDRHHLLDLEPTTTAFTHVRLNIFPDGGVARFKLFGRFAVDWRTISGETDLAAAAMGAVALLCSDTHYGHPRNILMPGRGANMGEGWETRRRREPGFDWAIIQLAHAGYVSRLVIDTAHFKGNFPHQCSVQGAYLPDAAVSSLASRAMFWPELLTANYMSADSEHRYPELNDLGALTHLRINMHPDGGIMRLRAFGMAAHPT